MSDTAPGYPGTTRSTARETVLAKLWHGSDPFVGFPADRYTPDMQGWGSSHPYLGAGVEALRPAIIVEIGVWKGGSVISMASRLKALGVDGVVIAVDTWLGAWDHWLNRRWFHDLSFEWGMPQLMRTFMCNVATEELQDYVVPLPLDSNNAAVVLRAHRLKIDMIHIDAGHDKRAVLNDLEIWWPLLRPGGLLIGDDYEAWAGVRAAFDEFAATQQLPPIEYAENKCRLFKPA